MISVGRREIGPLKLHIIGDASVYYIDNYPFELGKVTYSQNTEKIFMVRPSTG